MILLGVSVLVWLTIFYMGRKAQGFNVPYSVRGGGGGQQAPAPPPPAPAPAETSREAISAQIEATPRILETQREFGPQFTQLQLEQLQQFGPEFTEAALGLAEQFGGRLAEQTRAEQAILAPERVAGSEQIAQFLGQGPDLLTSEEEKQFRQDVRAAQATRGLAESGFGAQEEFEKLTGLRQQLKNRFLDVALSASGRLPAAGAATVGAPQQAFGPGQLVQNVTPSEFFGAQAARQGAQASIFGTQAGISASQPGSPFGQIAGGLAGGLAGGFGGSFGSGLANRFF